MFNAHLFHNTVCFNNNIICKKNEIYNIKKKDKNNFRQYNIIDNRKSLYNKTKLISGNTIHYIFNTQNIAHFIYDTFFHLMYLIEYNKSIGNKINNLLLYIGNDNLRNIPINKECIHKSGDYITTPHYWCSSVLLSYIDDLNINLIVQEKDINYECENIIIVGEDRGLRFPKLANILKHKVFKYCNISDNEQKDILIYNRRDTNRRIIINDVELVNELKNRNTDVKLVDSLSNISFYDQIKMLNSYKTFISPTGANMTNIIFMNRDINIIEIDNRNSWPLMWGTYKLFKKYNWCKFKLIHNENKANPNGSIQQNSEFDNNYKINIIDLLKYT